MTARLLGTSVPPSRLFDVALLDLDGVVYVGDRPVPGVADALARVRADGMRLAFVTNNASRPAQQVADRLTGMGVPADVAEVVTSAQAAAHFLADRLPAGAAVLVVGGAGLREALQQRGLRPVTTAVDPDGGGLVPAVVQGFDPTVDWHALAEAAVAIRGGARWVATNLDRTLPSERGALPGNGALVHTLTYALGVEPEATGKPDPTMHRESVERSRADRPIVVGDRLDTDIGGAVAAGAPSLLVLSGIADAAAVVTAPAGQRPDLIARDLSGLLDVHPEVVWPAGAVDGAADGPRGDGNSEPYGRDAADGRGTGRWRALPTRSGVAVWAGGGDRDSAAGDATARGSADDGPGEGAAGPDDDDLDGLRTVAVAAWAAADAGRPTTFEPRDEKATRLVERLDLGR